MARFASRRLGLDELVPEPPLPPPALRSRGPGQVPPGVWLGLATLLAHFSLPLTVFTVTALAVYWLLLRAVGPGPTRAARRSLWRHPRPSSLAEPEQLGLWGEIKVLRQLTRLGDEYVVLHDVVLPAPHGETQVDIVVVGPGGVTCVEVKAWRGRVYGRRTERFWTQVKLYGGQTVKDRRGNPLEQNLHHCQAAREYLQQVGYALPVHSLVVFTAADLRLEASPEVVGQENVVAALTGQTPQAPMTPEAVADLARALRRRLGEIPGQVLPVPTEKPANSPVAPLPIPGDQPCPRTAPPA